MADRSFDKVARELSSDFSALREDLRKLTSVVTDLAGEHADASRSSLFGAVGKARSHLSDRVDEARSRYGDAADEARGRYGDIADLARSRFNDTADALASRAGAATDRVRGAGAEIESRIEKNPLTAVMIAIVGGLLIGALSRSRR